MHLVLLAIASVGAIQINPEVRSLELGPRLELLEDKAKVWRLEDVRSQALSRRFRSSGGEVPNQGFTSSAYWYRVRLISNATQRRRFFVEMSHVTIDRLELFIQTDEGFDHYRMGDTVEGGGRVLGLTDYAVPVELAPGEPTWIYVRGENQGSLQMPLTLWGSRAFFGAISNRLLLYGPIFGLLLMLLIYNLFLLVVVRDISYGHISLCVCGAFLYLAYFTGVAQAYFFAHAPWLANFGYPLSMIATHLPMWLFTRRFLELHQRAPLLDRIFLAFGILGLAAVPLVFVASYLVTQLFVIAVIVPGVVVSMLSGIVILVRGYRPARYYVAGWALFFIGIVVFTMEKSGLLTRSLLTNNIHVIGYVATLVVLPLGLAERIRTLRREKAEAQAKALAAQTKALEVQAEAAAQLELEVSNKTADLRDANEQLGERNVQLQREIEQREQAEQERVALERSLFQSQKMDAIGRLAGGVAHDMNNILAVISLTTQGVQAGLTSEAEVNAALEDVLAAAKRGGDLARNLLGFARRGHYQKQRLSLNHAIEEIHRLLRRTIHQGVEIRLELAADLPELEGDPNQIGQILVNLAVNAAHAMSDKGLLTIRTSWTSISAETDGLAAGRYVRLQVSDTGAGMDEATRAQVFEPFFTTKAPGEGTGLGLSMVYGAVEAHGGRVTIDSTPGEGTTLIILLPALEGAAPAQRSGRISVRGPTPEVPIGAVLLVDDELMLRRSTSRLLKRLGYQVLEAEHGEQAVEILGRERNRILVVLLDLVMPVMDGPEAFFRMREIEPELKVVLCSGFSEEGHAAELLEAGAIAFLQKPYDLETLKRAIEAALV